MRDPALKGGRARWHHGDSREREVEEPRSHQDSQRPHHGAGLAVVSNDAEKDREERRLSDIEARLYALQCRLWTL